MVDRSSKKRGAQDGADLVHPNEEPKRPPQPSIADLKERRKNRDRAALIEMLHDIIDGSIDNPTLWRFAWEKLYDLLAPPPQKNELPKIPKRGELSDAELVEFVRAELERQQRV
jgi:hypothetical protein